MLTDAESLLREEFKTLRERGLEVFEQREEAASRAFRQKAFPQAFDVDASRKVKEVRVPTTVEDLKVLAERVAAYRGKEVQEESIIEGRRM
ncbi:hypothetical protein [Rubrobacter calidifluminis]|uniref:hypothetical protein n=1 Tax=Rubrobacter calidifluminis TaxID=1392640 RepID=UPI00235EAC00|nr:hypothetical protein [Rubrobacter calidifluminis]